MRLNPAACSRLMRLSALAGGALLAMAAAVPARAQSTDWTGATSNDWFTPGNWTNGVPAAGVTTIDTISPNSTVLDGGAAGGPAGSTFDLFVGRSPGRIGTLIIQNGGRLSSADGSLGTDGTGTVTVTGPGSTWSNAFLEVANNGTATLIIEKGGVVTSSVGGSIASNPGSKGTVTVTGAGSAWNMTGTTFGLNVGNAGTATLTIENGGTVSSQSGTIAGASASQGTVVVTGPGSAWTMRGDLFVGNFSTGTLTIANGGAVSSARGVVGSGPGEGAKGVVTVTGPGSTWNMTDVLVVGNNRLSVGSLTIVDGGVVSAPSAFVGNQSASTGTVNVGAGSAWNIGGDLFVGAAGTGTLTIADGGIVSAVRTFVGAATFVGATEGGVGIINIGAAPGEAPRAPGTLNTPTVLFGNLFGPELGIEDVPPGISGTINFNHTAADYIFAPAVSGPINVNALAGTTIFTAANTYSGPTLVDGGTLKAGTAGTFSPNSEHTVTGAGTLDLAGFNQSVLGLTNAGLVNFGTGTAPGTTLTTSNYVGQGGTLAMNTFLGADASPSDRLIINGGTASGSSLLSITNAGGAGALTVANGILVVDAINGGTTAPGAFALAGPVLAGPFEYTLFRSSRDAGAPESWFLRSTIDCVLAPTNPACAVAPPTPQPQVPNFRQEVSLYAALPALALLYGRTLMDTLHQRVGEEEHLRPRTDIGNPIYLNGAWGRVIAQSGDRDGDRAGILGGGPKYDFDFMAIQAGLDVWRQQLAGGYRTHAGVYGALGDGRSDVAHFDGTAAGRDSLAAYTAGGYWTLFGPTGWYLDSVIQGTFYGMKAQSTRLPALETDGWGFAASLEGGVPFKMGGGFTIEPQAQLVYQSVDLDTGRDIAATVRFDDIDSLAARLGIRFATSWTMPGSVWGLPQPGLVTAWFRPSYWHEFSGDPRTLFSSETGFIPFRADLGGDWLELNTGVSARIDRITELYANASYQWGLDGRSEAWDGKIGLRVNW